MYISKMVINEEKIFDRIFFSEYSLHQAVWSLFADSQERKRDFLYRLEMSGGMPLVHSVSERKPSDSKGIWLIESKVYKPELKTGTRLGFSVTVNPTRKKDGKRHDVVMNAKYLAKSQDKPENVPSQEIIHMACKNWLEERAEKNGFRPLQFRSDGYRQLRFNKSKGGEAIRYSIIELIGLLEVTDSDTFIKMLFSGLGPEKGFGCGLMLVRRI